MTNEAATGLAVLLTGVIALFLHWNYYQRRFPLSAFGLTDVHRVLRWETPAQRQAILCRGWLTMHEWKVLNRRQIDAICAELERRRISVDTELQRLGVDPFDGTKEP